MAIPRVSPSTVMFSISGVLILLMLFDDGTQPPAELGAEDDDNQKTDSQIQMARGVIVRSTVAAVNTETQPVIAPEKFKLEGCYGCQRRVPQDFCFDQELNPIPNSFCPGVTKKESKYFCSAGYALEAHETSWHGDVCRMMHHDHFGEGNDRWECPTGCAKAQNNEPPYCVSESAQGPKGKVCRVDLSFVDK